MKNVLLAVLMLISISSYSQHTSFSVKVYGNGQPIILIPGYGCSGDVWNETVENFKNHYQLHVITLAGFAGVPAIDTPILETVKNELIQYVKDNHLNHPVIVGHSLGGFLALWVASEAPDLFSKIISVDGVPFLPAMMNSSITAQQLNNDPSFNPQTIAINFKNIPDKDFEEKQFKKMLTMVKDTAYAKLITQWNMQSDRQTLAYTYIEMSTTDLRNKISKINIPVLVLGSNYSTVEASQKLLEDQYQNLPKKLIVVANTKHFIMYDDPKWFREQIKNFLENGVYN